jgi:hypothetical protein
MLSAILGDFIENVTELSKTQNLPLAQPVAFGTQWEEQGGPRTIRFRITKGKGAGPDFYGFEQGGTLTNQMVRKVWTHVEVQCWGNPATSTQYPDPNDQLLHNTDDTENLRQIVIVGMNQAIPGGYRYIGEVWNQPGEVMGYGRCLTITFALEQPIPDLQPYNAIATIEAVQLTGEVIAQ